MKMIISCITLRHCPCYNHCTLVRLWSHGIGNLGLGQCGERIYYKFISELNWKYKLKVSRSRLC